MPWTKTENAAQFGGSDWSNHVKTVHNTTPEEAQRMAFRDPSISYFFYCRGAIALSNGRTFQPGDAVFFNDSQQPWYGSAPQCDSYKRLCVSVAYGSAEQVQSMVDMTYGGRPALDAVIIAVNLNLKTNHPSDTFWLDPNGIGPTMLRGNPDTKQMLDSDAIKYAHSKGIAVILCGLNNHDAAGWSQFASTPAGVSDAEQFAQQWRYSLDHYLADGVDIDDEYSNGQAYEDSLAMASYYVREAIGDRSFSKALWSDTQYFNPNYEGSSLGKNLTWGWTMSYWEGPKAQLCPYTGLMKNNQLLCGFQDGPEFYGPTKGDIDWMKDKGYAGVMVYKPLDQQDPNLLNKLLGYWSDAE